DAIFSRTTSFFIWYRLMANDPKIAPTVPNACAHPAAELLSVGGNLTSHPKHPPAIKATASSVLEFKRSIFDPPFRVLVVRAILANSLQCSRYVTDTSPVIGK
ncbi:hypothetical protein, partial [Paraburkholderia sediminicola]|uniref:hypothetical protein n=1 Tax=Paraburkholderia sediminicola TaxID=458836 RepID=UPI0038B6BE6B